MSKTTTEIAPGHEIPADNLSTAVLTNEGTIWLYGYRAWNGVALFSAVEPETNTVVLHNRPWSEAFRLLGRAGLRVPTIEETLRAILPEEGAAV